jgi:cell shape-determining protein MreC
MRKNYPQDKNRWPLTILIIVVIYFVGSFFFGWLAKPVAFIARPLLVIEKGISADLATLKNFFIFKNNLIQEKEKLNQENIALRLELADTEILKKEISDLKDLLGLKEKEKKYDIVSVLSGPGQNPYDILLLDFNASSSAVSVGKTIFADDDFILGKIISLNGSMAQAKLFSSADTQLSVTIGDQNIPATAIGQGNGNFFISLPRDTKIKEGDAVRVSSVGQSLLGLVGKIIKEPNDPFQKIYFRSPVNLSELKWVKVLK